LIVRICCLPRMLCLLRLTISACQRYWQKSLSMWRNCVKQDMSADTAAAGKSMKATQSQKPKKNLYEPYSTPRLFWELILRPLFQIVIFLTMRLHLHGRYNIPKRGPYIIAANHLAWLDVLMIPTYVPGRVVYMAKEEV